MNIKCLSAIVLLFFYLISNAQDEILSGIIPVSPETHEIQKSITDPVNYNTGKPIVEISLHEIEFGNKIIPIKLSYRAGIKVNQTSSWVGLGWTLHAEPSISRTIKGRPDDGDSYPYIGTNFGNFDRLSNLIGTPGTEVPPFGKEVPDIFYYNLFDKSGAFMFEEHENAADQTGTFVQLPFTGVDIKYQVDESDFTLLDNDGTKYYFGNTNNNDYNEWGSNSPGEYWINSWKASKVTTANENWELRFLYSCPEVNLGDQFSSDYVERTWSSYDYYRTYEKESDGEIVAYDHGVDGVYEHYFYSNGNWIQNGQGDYSNNNISYTKKNPIAKIYIYTRDDQDNINQVGEINFEEEEGRLKEIKVFNADNVCIKTITFTQTTYSFNNAIDSRRYKLDKIIMSNNGEIDKSYEFEYYEPDTELSFDSKRIDYFGYFNGKNNNELVSQKLYDNGQRPDGYVEIGTADRNGNDTYAKVFSLKKVTLPTGGYKTFEYESNEVFPGYYVSPNIKFGVRIKKIETRESDGQLLSEKHFEYETGYSNELINTRGGILYSKNKIDAFSTFTGNYNPTVYSNVISKDYSGSMATNHIDKGGPEVVYGKVTEYYEHPYSPNKNGRTEYYYNVGDREYMSDNSCIDCPDKNYLIKNFQTYPWNGIPLSVNNGIDLSNYELKEKRIYKYDVSLEDYIEIKREEYDYEWKSDPAYGFTESRKWYLYDYPDAVYKDIDKIEQVMEQYEISQFNYRTDDIITSSGALIKNIKTTEFLESGNLINETFYEYENNNHLLPSRIYSIDSKGDTRNRFLSYSGDFSSGIFSEMLNKNMIIYPIEEISAIGDVDVIENEFVGNVLTGTLVTYKNGDFGHVVKDKEYALETQDPIDFDSFVQFDGITPDAEYQNKISYEKYNKYGSPTEIHAENGVKTSVIWGYENTYPIIIADNVDFNTLNNSVNNALIEPSVNITGGISSLIDNIGYLQIQSEKTLWVNFNKALRAQIFLNNSSVKTFSYNPSIGITSEIDLDGKPIYYEYDYLGRLAKVLNYKNEILKAFDYNYKNQ